MRSGAARAHKLLDGSGESQQGQAGRGAARQQRDRRRWCKRRSAERLVLRGLQARASFSVCPPPTVLPAAPTCCPQLKKGKQTNTINYHLQRLGRMIRR